MPYQTRRIEGVAVEMARKYVQNMKVLILLVEGVGQSSSGAVMREKEVEFKDEIACLEAQRTKARKKVIAVRARLVEMESELIRLNILIDRKTEELRLYCRDTVDSELDARDLEIERFKEVFPKIAGKI